MKQAIRWTGRDCKEPKLLEETLRWNPNSPMIINTLHWSPTTRDIHVLCCLLSWLPYFHSICLQVLDRAKFHLLQCATKESVLRLDRTMLRDEAPHLQRIYMEEQKHEDLFSYLSDVFTPQPTAGLRIQVSLPLLKLLTFYIILFY